MSSVGRRSAMVMRLASHGMRPGFYMGYAPPGTSPPEPIALAQEAERLGYDSAWAAEAWGTDCVTVLSWLGATTEKIKLGSAIMQIPGRTPSNTAMTAATLDLLSGGRFLLGLGTSGPQVVEGWHGEQWGKPLEKTREYVEIVRSALRRDLLEHHGTHYDVAVTAPVILIDDVEAGREFLKPYYALYIGGMGARGKNFYNDLACRYGYEDAAREIQDLYLDGHKRDAAAAVPDAFVDEVALVGPKERLAERIEAWRESGATSLLVSTQQPEALQALAEI